MSNVRWNSDHQTQVDRNMEGVEISGWKLVGNMGKGTITDTFLACNGGNRKIVARKLFSRYATSDEVRVKFLSLSQFSAKIKIRKHIAVISGQHSSAEGVFLLREFVEGESLRSLLDKGKLPVHSKARILLDLCEAVRALRRADLVHAGIHPGNVIIQPDGRAKLTDFCASRFVLARRLSRSYPIEALRYFAPEQWRGGCADERTDLYAVGLIAYLLETGVEAFGAVGDHAELRERICQGVASEAPLLTQMFQVDPEKRFKNAEELSDALKAHYSDSPTPQEEAAVMPQPCDNVEVASAEDGSESLANNEVAMQVSPPPPCKPDGGLAESEASSDEGEGLEAQDTPSSPPPKMMNDGILKSVYYINEGCELLGNTPNTVIQHPRRNRAGKLALQLSNTGAGELEVTVFPHGDGINVSETTLQMAPGAKKSLIVRIQPDSGEFTNVFLEWRERGRKRQLKITIIRT